MTVMRVERVVYGVPDLDECVRFFTDFGLEPLDGGGTEARFATQTGQVIELRTSMTRACRPRYRRVRACGRSSGASTTRRRSTSWR